MIATAQKSIATITPLHCMLDRMITPLAPRSEDLSPPTRTVLRPAGYRLCRFHVMKNDFDCDKKLWQLGYRTRDATVNLFYRCNRKGFLSIAGI